MRRIELGNCSFVENDNFVGIEDGVETMGDNENCAVLEFGADCFLDVEKRENNRKNVEKY